MGDVGRGQRAAAAVGPGESRDTLLTRQPDLFRSGTVWGVVH